MEKFWLMDFIVDGKYPASKVWENFDDIKNIDGEKLRLYNSVFGISFRITCTHSDKKRIKLCII